MAKEDSLEEFWQLFKNASREKQKEILRKIQKASNKSKRLEHITNSLLTASKEGNLEAVTSILEGGFDPNRKGKLGNTPLHMAALGGHLEIVKLLIENGAVLNQKNDRGKTPLDAAKLSKNKKLISFLQSL